MDHNEVILKGRLDGKQRNRLKRLLDMEYKPSELASEILVNLKQIYSVYIPLGCPIEKDKKGYIAINGQKFKEWYIKSYQKAKVSDNETFCKTCKKAVPIINPIKQKKKYITYLISQCPNCERRCAKIIQCKKGVADD